MANNKERYQVIGKGVETKNFVSKRAAESYRDRLRKEGHDAQVWDMLDNPLSRAFSSLFR